MRKRIVTAIAAATALFVGSGTALALTHTVQSGDSLSRIATRYNVPGGWEAVYDANRGVIGPNPNMIQVGQRLEIPQAVCPTPTPSPTPTPTPHVLPIKGTGVYSGPGEVADIEGWLGGGADATDYLDPAWNDSWNPTALKRWGDWKKKHPGRKFVLGLHLVPEKGGSLAAGNRGSYDSQFRALTQMLVDNGLGDSVIRLGYEPNNPNIGPWQGTSDPEGYKKLYRRIHGVMKKVAPKLRFDYNLTVGRSGKATSWWSLYPGSAYVDIVGLNVYDMWWQHPTATPQQRWNHILTTAIGVNDQKSFAAYVGKPVSYPEWGLYKKGDNYAGGGDSAYFIDRMAELSKGAEYNAYFDLNWTSLGSSIDMFPNGKAQYEKRFGAP